MKKALIIILVSIIVLLPTICALLIYLVPDYIIQTPINIHGVFSDGEETYEFNRNKNTSLALFFNDLDDNGTPGNMDLSNIKYDKVFTAEIDERNTKKIITIYASLFGHSYYSVDGGELYLINRAYSNTLLNSEFAIGLYEDIYTPALLTFSNDAVTPSSTDFKYTFKDGSAHGGRNNSSVSKVITYRSSVTSYFKFSIKPDICNLNAYAGDKLIYSGALYDFDDSTLPKNSLVKFEIEATWVKSAINDCFGTANYSFLLDYTPAPTFTLADASIEAGELIIVKANNILNPEKIVCTLSNGEKCEPKFFANGDDYYALIPFSSTLPSGSYKLTLNCGETTTSATINVTERTVRTQPAEEGTYDQLTNSALSDKENLLVSIGNKCSPKNFGAQSFINYENTFSIRLGYGHERYFSEEMSVIMDGVDYYAEADMPIPVMGNGVVSASGEDAILGKYVVVDHGFGLKSWYCNISEALYSVGDEVKKGDIIAKTGASNFYGQPGFYLITTVLDTPVSPYAIYENNFALPAEKE